MNEARPSNYTSQPMGSVAQNSETESIARNIMVILKISGDVFRNLSFGDYGKARIADGATQRDLCIEKQFFERAIPYCITSKLADEFCSNWFTASN